MCVCVCVCVCVRVRACVCVCVCVHVWRRRGLLWYAGDRSLQGFSRMLLLGDKANSFNVDMFCLIPGEHAVSAAEDL